MKALASIVRLMRHRSLGVVASILLLGAAGQIRSDPLEAQPAPGGPGPAPITATVPSCDPRTLVTRDPGLGDASGAGGGISQLISYTDTAGSPLPDTTGTVSWSYRAIVRQPTGMPTVSHDIAGYLNLDITTAAGHRLSFRAHCIAGAGMVSDPTLEAVLIYANGVTTGWPRPDGAGGGAGARRTFVHFESFRLADGRVFAYVALVDGEDCALNFDVLLVTERLARGSGTFNIPQNVELYTKTDCSLLTGPGRSIRGGPPGRLRP